MKKEIDERKIALLRKLEELKIPSEKGKDVFPALWNRKRPIILDMAIPDKNGIKSGNFITTYLWGERLILCVGLGVVGDEEALFFLVEGSIGIIHFSTKIDDISSPLATFADLEKHVQAVKI